MLQKHRLQLVYSALLVLALFAVIPQLSYFRGSWHLLTHVDWWYVVLASLALLASYIFAAFNYVVLAFRKLPLGVSLIVQLAASALNRILPSGVGGLGITYLYLKKNNHTTGQALAALSVNNLAGVSGHGLLVLLVLLVSPSSRGLLRVPNLPLGNLIVLACLLVVFLLALGRWQRPRLARFWASAGRQVRFYRRHGSRLVLVLASSVGLTLCYALMTALSIAAVGGSLGLGPCVIVLAARTVGIAAVPTPSGLGGAEAATVAILIGYGLDSPTALAASLIMRLATYIVSFGPGVVAAVVVRHRAYI